MFYLYLYSLREIRVTKTWLISLYCFPLGNLTRQSYMHVSAKVQFLTWLMSGILSTTASLLSLEFFFLFCSHELHQVCTVYGTNYMIFLSQYTSICFINTDTMLVLGNSCRQIYWSLSLGNFSILVVALLYIRVSHTLQARWNLMGFKIIFCLFFFLHMNCCCGRGKTIRILNDS